MPSSGRHILDIKKKGPSRAKARSQMTPLFSPRPPRLRARRRKMRILMFCICILCGAGIVGGLGAVSHLERLAIRDISTMGTKELAPHALIASVAGALEEDAFRLFSRENIFLYPQRAIEEGLVAAFPRIKDVSLSRPSLLAQAVIVTVEEREPFAKWCPSEIGEPSHGAGPEDTCVFLDESGFIFAEVGTESPDSPDEQASRGGPKTSYVFRGGLTQDSLVGQWFLRGRIETMIGLFEQLQAASFDPAGAVVENEKDFKVLLRDGPALLIAFDIRPETVVRNLETALEADGLRERLADLEYIDLRFGNRVYYK